MIGVHVPLLATKHPGFPSLTVVEEFHESSVDRECQPVRSLQNSDSERRDQERSGMNAYF